jgi:hypothetical protein
MAVVWERNEERASRLKKLILARNPGFCHREKQEENSGRVAVSFS